MKGYNQRFLEGVNKVQNVTAVSAAKNPELVLNVHHLDLLILIQSFCHSDVILPLILPDLPQNLRRILEERGSSSVHRDNLRFQSLIIELVYRADEVLRKSRDPALARRIGGNVHDPGLHFFNSRRSSLMLNDFAPTRSSAAP